MLNFISKLDWPAIVVVILLMPYILYINGFKDDPKFLKFCLRMNRRIYNFLVFKVEGYMRKRAHKVAEHLYEVEKEMK